jgi:hypothetical protein
VSGQTQYQYLDHWPGSHYRQLFYKQRKIRAETLYRATVGPEPRTPEEVAEDYDIPVDAVHEAIHYCTNNADLLQRELQDDLADMHARGMDKPPPVTAELKAGQ